MRPVSLDTILETYEADSDKLKALRLESNYTLQDLLKRDYEATYLNITSENELIDLSQSNVAKIQNFAFVIRLLTVIYPIFEAKFCQGADELIPACVDHVSKTFNNTCEKDELEKYISFLDAIHESEAKKRGNFHNDYAHYFSTSILCAKQALTEQLIDKVFNKVSDDLLKVWKAYQLHLQNTGSETTSKKINIVTEICDALQNNNAQAYLIALSISDKKILTQGRHYEQYKLALTITFCCLLVPGLLLSLGLAIYSKLTKNTWNFFSSHGAQACRQAQALLSAPREIPRHAIA